MRAVLVIVTNVLREQSLQMAFVQCDDVIQQVTTTTADPALGHAILPRAFERSANRVYPQGSNGYGDFQAILCITIKDNEPRSRPEWKCFPQLLDGPETRRVLCDVEVQDAPTIMTDDEKAIEH